MEGLDSSGQSGGQAVARRAVKDVDTATCTCIHDRIISRSLPFT